MKLVDSIAESFTDSIESALPLARQFVCLLYGTRSKMTNVHCGPNYMRVKLSKDNDLACIPPCENSYKQHV